MGTIIVVGMDTRGQKRPAGSKLESKANKIIRTLDNSNLSMRDEDDTYNILSQSSSNGIKPVSQSVAEVHDNQLCNVCGQVVVILSTDVTCLQCCLCDEYYHGSCLEVANSTLLDFLYVVTEIGGWCCSSCRLTNKTGKPTKGLTKAARQQEHVNQELQSIKNQLSILSTNLLSISRNIPAPPGDGVVQSSDLDQMISFSDANRIDLKSFPSTYAQIVASNSVDTGKKNGGADRIPDLREGFKTAILSAVHTEMMTRDKRALNIVVSGMKTSNLASDAIQFSELCSSEFNIVPTIRSTFRLGRIIEGRIQPLLVTLGSSAEVDDLIRRASQLRFSRSPQVRDRIFLNKHMTRAEALAAYNARVLRRAKGSGRTNSGDLVGLETNRVMDPSSQLHDVNANQSGVLISFHDPQAPVMVATASTTPANDSSSK